MVSLQPPDISSSTPIAETSPNQQILPLSAEIDQAGQMVIGGCLVTDLVKQFGSPLYIVDELTLRTACQQYRLSFQKFYPGPSQILYASKAWSCMAISALVANEGLGLDVVSGGELYTALQAGVDPETIYFHGNNKSVPELEMALSCGCTIIADNWLELEQLTEILATIDALPNPPRVMLRITPGIECHTHEYIRTGHLDSKFGFDPNQIDQVLSFAQKNPQITWVGFHAHIGSQIFELQPHQDLTSVIVEWLAKAQALGLSMNELNIGGGLGIRYVESDDPPSIAQWSEIVCNGIAQACQTANIPLPKLLCEPGRSLVGTSCITAYTVGAKKNIPDIRTYLSVDGGMSDNPRPITYQSVYSAAIANHMDSSATEIVTVAGKHCESGDVLLKDIPLPPSLPGDILVVMGTGAYNYSMASNYNRISRPAAVLVQNGDANLILKRETYQDLIRQDCLPRHLEQ
ncbi:diaminopimelate decarboxylase [Acaryochloris sp. CCMEE 5410]|uniref:diaminopimelate decarboxylase n=1 Tax=Acaryochloris sp. CCMEE 5410 TaxID=310037 RepID=UPI0002485015|nr:diaminopimelate decarboxylase [Acaryochloris sp. CCMEE 5410]KAI9130492.1 diaminopimelate decarboxylase [Acaryochloris sp. CCMEE 5410]